MMDAESIVEQIVRRFERESAEMQKLASDYKDPKKSEPIFEVAIRRSECAARIRRYVYELTKGRVNIEPQSFTDNI